MNTYKLVCEVLKELGVLDEALAEKEASNWKDDENFDGNVFRYWFSWRNSSKDCSYWHNINLQLEKLMSDKFINALGNGSLLRGRLAIYNKLLTEFSSDNHREGFCASLVPYNYIRMENLPELLAQNPKSDRPYWFPVMTDTPDINRISALNAAIKLTEEKLKEE